MAYQKEAGFYSRRAFLHRCGALGAGVLLPLPALARSATIHQLSGEVRLNGLPVERTTAIEPGQTLTTGANGSVWFTLGGDSYFLRPGTELLLRAGATDRIVGALRLVTGAIGATFRPGGQRFVIAQTVTIGIRGTGVYVDTSDLETYACNCFGAADMYSARGGSMMESVRVQATHHQARRILRDPQMGMRIVQAPFERHTNEEIARLERLAGRPNPF